jgi:hypothetical protein
MGESGRKFVETYKKESKAMEDAKEKEQEKPAGETNLA